MNRTDIVSPEDQSVTFVELFFDLVFVFAFTQVVGLLHEGITWTSIGQAVLVFWLVWWAWTQFTWALNPANTDHRSIQALTLLATAIAFFMAVAVPWVFEHNALFFAVPYVMVRAVGLHIYRWVAQDDPSLARAVGTFGRLSIGGMAAVLLGAWLGGPQLYAFWGLAILLDVLASGAAGSDNQWHLRPGHFAERHGLIIIIALGESLIVAAGGLSGAFGNQQTTVVAALCVALTCALWWSYFPYVRPYLERALEDASTEAEGELARDIYSLGHFPMLFGIIAMAAAMEEAVAHPDHALPTEGRAALAAGLFLFVGGAALGQKRAYGEVAWIRVATVGLTGAALFWLADVPPWMSLGIAVAGMAILTLGEYRACTAREQKA